MRGGSDVLPDDPHQPPFLLITASGDSCLLRQWKDGQVKTLLDYRSDYLAAQPEAVVILVDGRGALAEITISRDLVQ